jgi:hypothetical protein
MSTTISRKNNNKPAPKWFRKLKKAIGVLTIAANVMVQSWGLSDALLVAHIQLWCTLGIGAILEALEIVLANGEEYINYDNDYKKFYDKTNFLLLLISILLLVSCSSAKHTSKQVNDIEALQRQLDQQKEQILAKGIADYVKNNPCIYPELNLDSLCNMLDITPESEPDMRITDYGLTSTKAYLQEPYSQKGFSIKRKNILVPVEDNRLVNLLKDSLQVARNRYLECNSKQVGRYEMFKSIEESIKPGLWHFNNWAWLAIVLLLLLTGLSILFKSKIVK